MDRDDVIALLSTTIELWRARTELLTIGIDGYSGIGKTTILSQLLSENPSYMGLSMDAYASTRLLPNDSVRIRESTSEEFPLRWHPEDGLTKLRAEVIGFKGGKSPHTLLIVEGIFLLHPNVLRGMLDKTIYIHSDERESDLRRRTRDLKRWGPQYVPDTERESYARLYKDAFRKYVETTHPADRADIAFGILQSS